MTIHTGIFPYKCTECDRGFRTKKGVEEHLTKHTGEAYKSNTCKICGLNFKTYYKYAVHMNKDHKYLNQTNIMVNDDDIVEHVDGASAIANYDANDATYNDDSNIDEINDGVDVVEALHVEFLDYETIEEKSF